MNEPTRDTPEYVRWAVARSCPLRDFNRWRDPEKTERQLRPLRAYSDALAEDRLFDGICVEPSASNADLLTGDTFTAKGFRADEVLGFYGGREFAEAACKSCPANVSAQTVSAQTATAQTAQVALAGCYGWFEIEKFGSRFHDALDSVIFRLGWQHDYTRFFLPTSPRWYGLWLQSPLDERQTEFVLHVLRKLQDKGIACGDPIDALIAALTTSIDHQLPVHVKSFASGRATSTTWTIPSHCPRCKAKQESSARNCPRCHRSGSSAPPIERGVQGSRPYWPLMSFLGERPARTFLQRYLDYKDQVPSEETGCDANR